MAPAMAPATRQVEAAMLIIATSSGGFAGLTQRYEVDTKNNSLGPQLEALVATGPLLTAPAAAPAPSVGADLQRWQITVRDGEQEHTVTFADDGAAAAAAWKPLLAQLRAAAT
jgi:hypothetical protein